jgi:hypothetical protein
MKNVTKETAACIAQMNALKFKSIGSLSVRNPRVAPDLPERQLEPGTIISREMFWGDRVQQDACCGPKCSKDWLNPRLDIHICDLKERLRVEIAAEASDETEDLEQVIALAKNLQALDEIEELQPG